MPELPEVETTRRAIAPFVVGQTLQAVSVRQPHLRWPVPDMQPLLGQTVQHLERRAKYLIFAFPSGYLLLHLGMSGMLSWVPSNTPAARHDHIDWQFSATHSLRLTDSRRFGAVIWTPTLAEHPRLAHLGPEPLGGEWTVPYCVSAAQGSRQPIKAWLMSANRVVGIGNIYANEALFKARCHPLTPAGRLSVSQWIALIQASRAVLEAALQKGGTTLKDFRQPDGRRGYFSIDLQVYGRQDQPCVVCATVLQGLRLGGRQTVFCPQCQPKRSLS